MTRSETSSSELEPRYVFFGAGAYRVHKRREQVGIVVTQDALNDGRDSLEAPIPVSTLGAGRRVSVPSSLRSNCMNTRFQISSQRSHSQATPRHSGWSHGEIVTLIEVYFGAWTARPGVAHGPEVVFFPELPDFFWREVFAPKFVSFAVALDVVITFENRDRESLGVEPELIDEKLPREIDGFFLEVIAEREVPKHLEERVVTRGYADVFEVVVLATGADTLLNGRRPAIVAGFESEEDVLEVVHPRVHEQERGIVEGNERGALNDPVLVLSKVVEKALPYLSNLHHDSVSTILTLQYRRNLARLPIHERFRARNRAREGGGRRELYACRPINE